MQNDLEEFFSVHGSGSTHSSTNGLEDPSALRKETSDPRELERALWRQNDQRMAECEDHSSFNPFSLSNSNSNFNHPPSHTVTEDAWEIDYYITHHPNTNPQPFPSTTSQQASFPITIMEPNDPNHQGYYYPQNPYSQYTPPSNPNPYAPSSSASNPTSPQNSFIPIYTSTLTNPNPPSYSSNQPYSSSPDQNSSGGTIEEHELKRLRNTAASARFRAKKKQREAQLESSSKEKKERLEALEKRIHDLEEENKWLKGLIMEKKDVAGEVQRLRERFGAVSEEMREFEERGKDDGVGTGGKGGKKK